jgi:hypothetical protein
VRRQCHRHFIFIQHLLQNGFVCIVRTNLQACLALSGRDCSPAKGGRGVRSGRPAPALWLSLQRQVLSTTTQ